MMEAMKTYSGGPQQRLALCAGRQMLSLFLAQNKFPPWGEQLFLQRVRFGWVEVLEQCQPGNGRQTEYRFGVHSGGTRKYLANIASSTSLEGDNQKRSSLFFMFAAGNDFYRARASGDITVSSVFHGNAHGNSPSVVPLYTRLELSSMRMLLTSFVSPYHPKNL
ncbi:MAG: hypothetical protein LBS77_05105 [Desulfovibrio sp.]|nr:hypothetical protein [Desulfovibrio sp.]